MPRGLIHVTGRVDTQNILDSQSRLPSYRTENAIHSQEQAIRVTEIRISIP
jgi:hypothetical protein